MSDIALRVEGLGKRYRLGLQDNASGGRFRYKSLRDSLGGLAERPLQTLKSAVIPDPMDDENSFWALKDINFEVKKGEVVGIIGRNGAGKSTLLKILSRITKPTTGRVDLFGRVGSLLEVGTGFHPELSGSENIYLNGAILGMSQIDVKSKFNAIVDFSEVEKFIDTPVKHYSSGMYMRLAFAVAAYLDPDILVVDEVLAVGDAEFQRKCLGQMKSASEQGRTVLVVSHNLAHIRTICSRGIMLEKGSVTLDGTSEHVTEIYNEGKNRESGISAADRKERVGTGEIRVSNIELRDRRQVSCCSLALDEPLDFYIELNNAIGNRSLSLTVQNKHGVLLARFDSAISDKPIDPLSKRFQCAISPMNLSPGEYFVNVGIAFGDTPVDYLENAVNFTTFPGKRSLIAHHHGLEGYITPPHEWNGLI